MYGEVLRLLRVYNDYTATDLAAELGISQGYISELERGKKEPSLDVLKKYAKLFNLPVSSIMLMSENLESTGGKKTLKDKIGGFLVQALANIEKHGATEDTEAKSAS